MARTKERKKKKKDKSAVTQAAPNSPVVAENGDQPTAKKKKYERKLGVRDASEIAKYLTLNATNFKAEYNGNAKCVIRVDEDHKGLLDDLIDRITT